MAVALGYKLLYQDLSSTDGNLRLRRLQTAFLDNKSLPSDIWKQNKLDRSTILNSSARLLKPAPSTTERRPSVQTQIEQHGSHRIPRSTYTERNPSPPTTQKHNANNNLPNKTESLRPPPTNSLRPRQLLRSNGLRFKILPSCRRRSTETKSFCA